MGEANEAKFSVYLWIADSGATTHICAQQDAFTEYMALPERIVKGLGDKPVSALRQGTVIIHTYINNHAKRLRLTKTLHVPEARENLLSLGWIDSAGGHIVCANGKMDIYDSDNNKVAVGQLKKSLYYLDV